MKKIGAYVYLNSGIMESIYYSQVEPVLSYVKERAERMLHISLESKGYLTKEFMKRRADVGRLFESEYLIQSRNLSEYDARKDAHKICRLIASRIPNQEKIVIHARGEVNAYKAVILKRKNPELYKVHADMRGVLWDEVTRGNFLRRLFAPYRRRLYRKWEKFVVHEADSISSVSHVFREYFQTTYGRLDTLVIPTFVDEKVFNYSEIKREEYRKRLSIEDEPVMIFCGGVSYWQAIDQTIELYKKLENYFSHLIMVFLSHEPNHVRQKIKGRMPSEKVRILKVPHREVAGYLCAADFGVLLREDIPTNNIAAPTKFGEYLCCGLPVLLSPRIGDTESMVTKTGFGYVIRDHTTRIDHAYIRNLLKLKRQDISMFGIKQFAKSVYLPKLMNIYKKDLLSP